MIGTIRGHCFTNLDDFKCTEWPDRFVAVPRKGERIQGKGPGYRTRPSLAVVGVTHCMDHEGPYIAIELHQGGR